MKKVYICSPYRGDVETNIKIAQEMMSVALREGCAPIAPHLLYPQVLIESIPEDRSVGLGAAMEWINVCEEMWVWGGIMSASKGMKREINKALLLGIPVKTFSSAMR